MNWILGLAVLLASAQSPVDFLGTGVAFTGPVTFKRGAADTTFTVNDHGAFVMVKLSTDEAFSVTPTESMSYKWGHTLAQARDVRIRLADVRDMPIGTELQHDSLELFICTIQPEERTDAATFYALQCVAYDQKIRPTSSKGGLLLEAGIVVSAPRESTTEQFLSKPRKTIYARLESSGG